MGNQAGASIRVSLIRAETEGKYYSQLEGVCRRNETVNPERAEMSRTAFAAHCGLVIIRKYCPTPNVRVEEFGPTVRYSSCPCQRSESLETSGC